jgi:hypothetical protein
MANQEENNETLGSKEIMEVLEKADSFAAVAVAIQEKYGCLLIPEDKWTSVSDALLEEVGEDNWDEDWDY